MRYPPVNFFFEVKFLGDNLDKVDVETRFQSVKGLDVSLESEPLAEGGENRFQHALPTRTNYSSLVLTRGLVKNSKLIAWCNDAILNYDIRPMNLLVSLLHVNRSDSTKPPDKIEPLMSWKVINAWPQKWSVSEFNAKNSEVVIETLELKYHYFEPLPKP